MIRILAQLALKHGAAHVYAVDIRPTAADSARKVLQEKYPGQSTVFCANVMKLSHRDRELKEALHMGESSRPPGPLLALPLCAALLALSCACACVRVRACACVCEREFGEEIK